MLIMLASGNLLCVLFEYCGYFIINQAARANTMFMTCPVGCTQKGGNPFCELSLWLEHRSSF